MEIRNGVYTSQTKARDAQDIEKWAKKIIAATTDSEIESLAKKIQHAARRLERDLR